MSGPRDNRYIRYAAPGDSIPDFFLGVLIAVKILLACCALFIGTAAVVYGIERIKPWLSDAGLSGAQPTPDWARWSPESSIRPGTPPGKSGRLN